MRHREWKVAGLVLAIGFVVYASVRGLIGDSDLVGFHETAVKLWQTGELTPESGWKFYLPGTAVLILPLVVWPMWITGTLWGCLNVAALWWSVRESARLAAGPEPLDDDRDFHIRWTLPLLAVFAYAADSIALGQFNLVVLALCLAAYRQGERPGRPLAAGCLAGLAAVIKLYPLILVPFWCARGQWKPALWAVLSFVLIAGGASLAVFGGQGTIDAHRVWHAQVRGNQYLSSGRPDAAPPEVRHMMFTDRPHQWMRHNNQSLASVVRRVTTSLPRNGGYNEKPVNVADLPPRTAYLAYLAMAGAVLAILFATTWRTRHDTRVPGLFAAWMACVVAFVPVYWTHYFVLLLPAAAMLCRARRTESWASLMLLAWIAGEVLLGIRPLRLIGLQCWLALAAAAWALCQAIRASGVRNRILPDTSVEDRSQIGDPVGRNRLGLISQSHAGGETRGRR